MGLIMIVPLAAFQCYVEKKNLVKYFILSIAFGATVGLLFAAIIPVFQYHTECFPLQQDFELKQ